MFLSELFPTSVRSLGLGWASAVGTVGNTIAPYLRLAADSLKINPWIAPGILGFIGVVSVFCLRETFQKPLQDEIAERLLDD